MANPLAPSLNVFTYIKEKIYKVAIFCSNNTGLVTQLIKYSLLICVYSLLEICKMIW